jgi:cysteine synthase
MSRAILAFAVIIDAEEDGFLTPNTNSRIFEGTVGSTGISIATIARARYYAPSPFTDD